MFGRVPTRADFIKAVCASYRKQEEHGCRDLLGMWEAYPKDDSLEDVVYAVAIESMQSFLGEDMFSPVFTVKAARVSTMMTCKFKMPKPKNLKDPVRKKEYVRTLAQNYVNGDSTSVSECSAMTSNQGPVFTSFHPK